MVAVGTGIFGLYRSERGFEFSSARRRFVGGCKWAGLVAETTFGGRFQWGRDRSAAELVAGCRDAVLPGCSPADHAFRADRPFAAVSDRYRGLRLVRPAHSAGRECSAGLFDLVCRFLSDWCHLAVEPMEIVAHDGIR